MEPCLSPPTAEGLSSQGERFRKLLERNGGSRAPVELELGAGAASLQLRERLGERSEYPQDEHRVQDRHRQHKHDARGGREVIDGSHVGHHVEGCHGDKVGRRQRDDLCERSKCHFEFRAGIRVAGMPKAQTAIK